MNRLLSRKFLLTILFGIIVVLNSVLHWGVTNEGLITLAASFGVYIGGNLIGKTQTATKAVTEAAEEYTDEDEATEAD